MGAFGLRAPRGLRPPRRPQPRPVPGMTKDKARMTKEAPSPNDEGSSAGGCFRLRASEFGFLSSFGLRPASFVVGTRTEVFCRKRSMASILHSYYGPSEGPLGFPMTD